MNDAEGGNGIEVLPETQPTESTGSPSPAYPTEGAGNQADPENPADKSECRVVGEEDARSLVSSLGHVLSAGKKVEDARSDLAEFRETLASEATRIMGSNASLHIHVEGVLWRMQTDGKGNLQVTKVGPIFAA